MKKIIRTFIIILASIKLAGLVIPTIKLEGGAGTIILASAGLTIFEYLIKPIAKILFLPINILTLGLLRWVIDVIGLYLVTLLVKGFIIQPYQLPQIQFNGLSIPSLHFSLLITYILASLLINLFVTILKWIFKK